MGMARRAGGTDARCQVIFASRGLNFRLSRGGYNTSAEDHRTSSGGRSRSLDDESILVGAAIAGEVEVDSSAGRNQLQVGAMDHDFVFQGDRLRDELSGRGDDAGAAEQRLPVFESGFRRGGYPEPVL